MKNSEILEIVIIILASFIIGFFVGGTYLQQKPIEIIQDPVIPIIKEIEKCQCSDLTREDVESIIRQEFVDALEFNYAIDDAFGKPRLVPLMKSICK